MEAVSTIDPNNEECNNGLHHTNGGHSTASKGSLDIDSFLKTLQKDLSNFNSDLANCTLPKVPPNGKNRGYYQERPIDLIDSNFRAVVFSGRSLFSF